jgi:NADH dehydrogenase
MAEVLAKNIAATMLGLPPQPFRFKTLGLLATIGRRHGVAEMLGMRFSGITAWLLWRMIYLGLTPGVQKKVRVVLDWTLDMFFSKDIVQLPTVQSPSISETEDSTRLPHPVGQGTHDDLRQVHEGGNANRSSA